MSEPPEWAGRGASDRSGWPNTTYREIRSHRPGHTPWEIDQEPSYDPDMPTDPHIGAIPPEPEPEPVYGQARSGRPVVRPQLVLEREEDPLERFALWLRICRDGLLIVLMFALLWLAGLMISRQGVPVWIARS